MSDASLAPRLRHRLGALITGAQWRRVALLRRCAAGLLVALALVLALAPSTGVAGTPVVVAALDVVTGHTLDAGDLEVREWPGRLVPAGALTDPGAAQGHVLIGAARAGEPITDVRLAGAGTAAALGGGPDAAAVPVRLSDGGVAELLTPGSRIDVVGESDGQPAVLAADAAVVTVLPAQKGPGAGRLVLVAMPRASAIRVAAASLSERVTITLR